MKHLKKYNIFIESLSSDFDESIKNYNNDLKSLANNFKNELPNETSKNEFMYRLTDGEDLIELIKDIINKYIPNENTFKFRAYVMNKEINDNKSLLSDIKTNEWLLNILQKSEENLDDMIEFIKNNINNNKIDLDRLKSSLSECIDFLQKNNEIINWTYQRPNFNPNNKKIENGNKIIDFITDYFE